MSSTEDVDTASTSDDVCFDNGMYSLYPFIVVCVKGGVFLVMSKYIESANKQRRALSLKTSRKRKCERPAYSPGKKNKKKVEELSSSDEQILVCCFASG